MLDPVDGLGGPGRVQFVVVGFEPGAGGVVQGAGVEELLVGVRGLSQDSFLVSGGGLGPADGLDAGQEVVLAGHDQVPQLVQQGQFGVGLVAVVERVAADPVAVALCDVGVVVVLVGPAAGDRNVVVVAPGDH